MDSITRGSAGVPFPASADPSDWAFLRAIAGDRATVATGTQIRRAADGLGGHAKNGVVDPVEATALLGVADAAQVSGYTQTMLVRALAGRITVIPILQRPQMRGRIPAFLDVASLMRSGNGADYGVYSDAKGNRMALWADASAPTQLAASFARLRDDPLAAPRVALSAGEADLLAPQLLRSQLAKARARPVHHAVVAAIDERLATTATVSAAADEHDLTRGAATGDLQTSDGHGSYTRSLGGTAFVRISWDEAGGDLYVQYNDGSDWGRARHPTRREIEALELRAAENDVRHGFDRREADALGSYTKQAIDDAIFDEP